MILLDNGDIKSESSSDEEMSPLEDCSDVDVAKHVNRECELREEQLSIQEKERKEKTNESEQKKEKNKKENKENKEEKNKKVVHLQRKERLRVL